MAGLLADPARRGELAAEARRLAEERYGWAAIGAAMADDIEALVTGTPARAVATAAAGPRGAA